MYTGHDRDTTLYIHKSISTQSKDKSLQQKFIDNTFYYVDDEFVYDKETYEKVGYKQNNEYVLTFDPFLLGN
jgi:hypothetical protein